VSFMPLINETEAKPDSKQVSSRNVLGVLQRKCACGGDAGPDGECEACAKKKLVQRKADHASGTAPPPRSVMGTLSSSGKPLDTATRNFMESRFGHDFGRVRIHTDSQAAASAKAVRAKAYTVGQDVAFGLGKYQPHTPAGRNLIAHELAHTVQQRGLQRSAENLSGLSQSEDSRYEAEADRIAERVVGTPLPVRPTPLPLSRAGREVLSRAKYEGPGNCGLNETETGKAAHTQIEAKLGAKEELVIPRAVKDGKVEDETCQRQGVGIGKADLWWKIANTIALAEIKPIQSANPDSVEQNELSKAAKEVKHYILRANQSIGRYCGKEPCGKNPPKGKEADGKDDDFAAEIGPLDKPPCKSTPAFKPAEFGGDIKVIGPFSRDPEKILHGQFFEGGAVGYWCAKSRSPDAEKGATIGFEVTLGKVGGTIDLPTGMRKGQKKKIADDSPIAKAFHGFILKEITKVDDSSYRIDAEIDPTASGMETQIEIGKAAKKISFDVDAKADPSKGLIKPKTVKIDVKVKLKRLSPGTITEVTPAEDGNINWAGVIKPSVPLLPSEVRLAYEQGKLRVETGKDEKTPKGPAPKSKSSQLFRLTTSTLGFDLAPELGGEGHIEGQFGPESSPIANADVKATLTQEGLTAQGDLKVRVPGLKETAAKVSYADGVWNAHVEISAESSDLPLSPKGKVVVDIDKEGIKPSGQITFTLPNQRGELGLGFIRDPSSGRFVFDGTGSLQIPIPGMKDQPVKVGARYDGEEFKATARGVGFSWKGLSGNLTEITYRIRKGGEGKTSGAGKLTINRNGITGEISVKFSEEGKFAGKGQVSYPFKLRDNDVIATAGIEIDEDQKVQLSGEMSVAQPIKLFDRFGDNRNLFHVEKHIPLPGVSIGPVGIVAVVEGGVSIHYFFGPGQLKQVRITAHANPLEPDPDLTATFHCVLEIPAGAGIDGTVGGGIGVDAVLGSVTGTLTVTAGLDLNGSVGGEMDVQYAQKKLDVKARPGLDAELDLGLSLDAHARAEAGIGRFSIGIEKDWNLGHKIVKLGQFSMHAPIEWSSDGGFKPPSLDQIEWKMPTVDFDDVLKQLMEGAPATEKKE
jgi:Domain of unknown function (DUF4157)